MSTQLIGFSIGGVARRFLVSPPSMIWPANLVNCALFNTLHSQQYAGMGERGGITRERFFAYAFTGAFVWCEPQQLVIVVCDSNCNIVQTSSPVISVSLKCFLCTPTFLRATVQALSYFSWVTWIRPQNTSTFYYSWTTNFQMLTIV